MLFITNRAFHEGSKSVPDRTVSFDLDNNEAGQSVYFCERKKKDTYTEVGGVGFMQKVKDSRADQALFYIHGFSNLPEEHIFPRAQELQDLFTEVGQKGLVQVIPLIWPCDNDFGIVKDYWDDQKAADASGFGFARVLEKFMEWRTRPENEQDPCLKRINVLAHSMGNRVLRNTLHLWAKYDRGGEVPLIFRNTFLAAADIVNECLEPGEDGIYISQSSRNVVVYYASDDLALRSSKVSNLKNKVASRRLGHNGPEDMDKTPKNVYALDCDNVNTAYDTPAGHTYFLRDRRKHPGAVFKHIVETIVTGRPFPKDLSQRVGVLGKNVTND